MDEILKIIILAVVQGMTEFLPISSSGHLVLIGQLLNIKEDSLLISAILHAGTLVAVLFVYFKEIRQFLASRRLLFLIFLSSIPAGFVGLALKYSGLDEFLFGRAFVAGFGLIGTAGILFWLPGAKASQEKEISGLSIKDAFWVGVAQCLAILPGLSRSGMTICACLRLDMNRRDASTYSFLMSIPVIAGATLIEIAPLFSRDNDASSETGSIIYLITGFIVSAIVGYFALNTVIESVRKNSISKYGYYCLVVGLVVLFIELSRFQNSA